MNQDEQKFLNALDKKLWTVADKLRSNLDAAVYKHPVLSLIFFKYVRAAYEERRKVFESPFKDPNNAYFLGDDSNELIYDELEFRDYYTEKNVFLVPPMALGKPAEQSLICALIRIDCYLFVIAITKRII